MMIQDESAGRDAHDERRERDASERETAKAEGGDHVLCRIIV